MKKAIAFVIFAVAVSAAFCGVPVKWSVETSRADERVIDVYHGESLDIEVTFKTYGQILEIPTNEVAATFWQTNGMATAYWRTNNVEIATNGVMRTTFGPEQDVGAKTIRGFIGIAGQIYRAAFVLRFKDAPGYNPAIVEWPYRLLDFNTIEVLNAPYFTKEEAYSANVVDEILEAYDLYRNATNREEIIVSNLTEWAEARYRKAEDSYTKTEISGFLEQLQTKADAISSTNKLDEVIRAWAEAEFQKSWELEEVQLGKDASATGTRTTAIGAYAESSGISAISLGNAAKTKGTYPIAIGIAATATNGNGIAIGSFAEARDGGVNIGVSSQWSKGYAKSGGVAIGTIAKADENGVAIGNGSQAGNQSVALGRGAKATHTAAVAIGPTAETVADSTMRIGYSPSEIYLGFFQAKSLQAYFDELTPPDIDLGQVSNIVNEAEHVPSVMYRTSGGTKTKIAEVKSTVASLYGRDSIVTKYDTASANTTWRTEYGSNVIHKLKSGSTLQANNGASIEVDNPEDFTVYTGNNRKTLPEYIASVSPAASWETLEGKPTNVSAFSNDVGYLTSEEITPTLVRSKLGSWIEFDEETGLYYYCHETEE